MNSTEEPDFSSPPVIEVALSVQFEPLTGFRVPQFGLLWRKFRDRYPDVEEHAPRDSVFEEFGKPRRREQTFKLERVPPIPQCWFIAAAGNELVQVQQDRFVHNWRKTDPGEGYPRYRVVKQRFRDELEVLRQFLREENLPDLAPNQCEVTYVNHIVAGEGWSRHGDLGEILTVWQNRYSDDFLREPEDITVGIRYVITEEDGKPIGRLLVRTDPVFRLEDDTPMYRMVLTARGRPLTASVEGALWFLDKGHEWVVRGFASITAPKLHGIWGMRDASCSSS